MQDRLKYNNRVVFTFVIIGVLSLLAFTSLILVKNKSFVHRIYYKTVLEDASGLSARPPIFFKGFEIGRIDKFELNPETNLIEVDFFIYEEYAQKIVKYAVLAKSENLLLGATNQFEIILPNFAQNQGLSLSKLKEGEVVPYIESELGQEYAAEAEISIKSDSLESILKSVDNLLLNLQKNDNPEAGSIFNVLDKLSKISDRVLKVADDIDNQNLVNELAKTIKNVQGLLENSNQTMTKAQQAIAQAESLFQSTNKTISSYSDPTAIIEHTTEGQIPRILKTTNQSVKVLLDILQEAQSQKEQLGLTIMSLRATLQKMEKTLDAVNNNPLLKGGITDPQEPVGLELNIEIDNKNNDNRNINNKETERNRHAESGDGTGGSN